MAASAAFLVPYERLRPESKHPPHPSGDGVRFAALAKRLDEFLKERFCGSSLCPTKENSWYIAKDVSRVDGELDSWFPPKSLKPVSKDKAISSMLSLIRNALAHGNLFTTGSPIERLIFVQRRGTLDVNEERQTSKFEVLCVSPDDFGLFIRGWVAFLRASEVPELYLIA
jgi:hypothetical protein